MGWLNEIIFDRPLSKAIAATVLGILGNVLSGAYVFEITETASGVQFINWAHSVQSRAFWWLMAVVVVGVLYGWRAFRAEVRFRKAVTTQADIREQVLQAAMTPLLKRMEQQIAAGEIDTLDEVMAKFGITNKGPQK